MQAARRPQPSRVPEPIAIQEYWSKIISSGTGEIKFKGGGPGGVTVLRKDVPRHWKKVRNTKGICCTYFVKGERHFLAMVSAEELAKMKGTIGDLEMTNHAKTLAYGMKAASKRKGVTKFEVVDACFGFWFDVCNREGVVYKFKSCANYFNHGHIATRQLANKEEKSLLAALDTVSAIPKDTKSDSKSDSESGNESDSDSVIDLGDNNNEEPISEETSEESSSKESYSESEPSGLDLVGRQIKVLREGNREWFFGKVVGFSRGKHLIHYDDGNKTKHVLKNEEWMVVGIGEKPKTVAGKKHKRTTEKKPDESGKKPKPLEPPSDGCQAEQGTGLKCRNRAKSGAQFCGRHEPKGVLKEISATEPEVDRICRARLPGTGERCGNECYGESRWCREHRDRWHLEECPVWRPSPAATVPEVEDPICPAWVAATGLRCTKKHREDSRWCGTHFNAYHGKDSPVWSPVPFAVEDPICLARVTGTGLRCNNKHREDSRWCGKHFNAWIGEDSPNW